MKQWLFPPCNIGFNGTLRLFANYKVEGQENIPRRGPVLIVANHLSNLDPAIVAAAIRRSPGFLAKKELFKFPLFAYLLRSYGAYPVDRGKADVRAVNWAVEQLRDHERAIVVFPEGTRSRGGGLLKAHPGVAHLANASGAPIVPVALTGSEPLQNMLKVFIPAARLRLQIGEPFRVKPGLGRLGRAQLETITTEIMVRLALLLPPEYQGHYREALSTPMQLTEDFPSSEPVAIDTRS